VAAVGKRVSEGGRVMRSATDWFVVGIFGAALLSHAVHTFLSLFEFTFETFGKVILLYFLIVNIVDSRRKLRALVVLLVLLTGFMAVHGVLQSYRGFGIGGQPPMIQNNEVVRVKAYGIFDDPNDLGLTLVVAMPLLLMWITARHGMGMRIIATGLLGLFGYALYLTDSRGGQLALVVMGFTYFYKRFGKAMSVLLGVGLLMGVMTFGSARMQSIGDDPSGAGRREVWSEGLTLLKHHPPINAVFGVGWNLFGEYAEEGKTAHNSYLLAVCEMGLVGLFFYLGLLYLPMRDLHRLTQANVPEELTEDELRTFQGDQALARALIASVIGFAAASFFLSRTYNQVPYVLIGMCAVLARLSKTDPVTSAALPAEEPENAMYDFHGRDFRRVAAGTLSVVPLIYVLCRVMWGM